MKELPYFKFNCSEWISGSITLEDLTTQGAFINICAYYWFKSGNITLTEINRRLKLKQATINRLVDGNHIKLNGDIIEISFLREQFNERGMISDRNSKNGSKGGAPKGNKNAQKNNPEQPKTSNKEEEIEIEEEKEEKNGAAEPLPPKLTVDERKKMFGEKCAIHLDEFGQVMLREFFNYWTEISEGGRKMRFEKEKTWELHKRLLKWKENSIKFSKNGKSGQQTDNHTKNTLDLMEGFKRRNADIFEGGQV